MSMTASSPALPLALDLHLPWDNDPAQDEKFKLWLKRALVVCLLLFLVVPFLPVFDKQYEQPETEIIKTQIILDPVIVEPEPAPEPPKPKPLEKKKQKAPKLEPVEPKPAPAGTPPPQTKENLAEEQGLSGLSDQLSALRQSMDLTRLQKKNVTESESGKVMRATKTVLGQDNLSRKSEGIVVDESLMNEQAVALAMHESTKLDGFIGGGGDAEGDNTRFYSNIRGQRSDESIRRVFEAGKSRVYMFYMRELRESPGLAGTFVFEVVIQPSGHISD